MIYVGTVKQIADGKVKVEVPDIGVGYYCLVQVNPKYQVAVGDKVALSKVNGAKEELYIVGHIDSTLPTFKQAVLNVMDFGAKGDGVTNDQAAFQAATNFIRDIGGGTLQVPNNTYIINGVVQVYSNTSIVGQGATITKTVWSPYSVFVVLSAGQTGYGSGAKNLHFEGFTFKGDFATAKMLCPFAFHHAQNVTVERCVFDQVQGTGHTFDLCGCDNITVRDCVWYGFYNNLTGGYRRSEAIELDISESTALSYPDSPGSFDGLFTKNVLVDNCQFLPVTVSAVDYPCPNPLGAHAPREGKYFENITFTNNVVLDPIYDDSGVTTDNGWLTGVLHFHTIKNLLISGNRFTQTKANRAVPAITVTSNSSNGSPAALWAAGVSSENIKIVNNVFQGFKPGVNSGTPDTNQVGQHTVSVRGVTIAAVNNVIVSGNTFSDGYNTTLSTGGRAVYITNATKVSVDNNEFYSYSTPVHILVTTYQMSVSNNRIDQTYGNYSALFENVEGGVVSNNLVRRFRGPMQMQGTSNNFTFTGNVCLEPQSTGNAANGIVAAGSRWTVVGNTIYNSGAVQPRGIAVANPTTGVIANNTVVGYTATVSGGAPDTWTGVANVSGHYTTALNASVNDIGGLSVSVTVDSTASLYQVTVSLDLETTSADSTVFVGYLNVNGTDDAEQLIFRPPAAGGTGLRLPLTKVYYYTGLATGTRTFKVRAQQNATTVTNPNYRVFNGHSTIKVVKLK